MTVLLCHPRPALMPSAFCLLPPKTPVLLPEFWCLSKALRGLPSGSQPCPPSQLPLMCCALSTLVLCMFSISACPWGCRVASHLSCSSPWFPARRNCHCLLSVWKLSTHCLGGSAPPCKCGNPVDEALVLSWFLLLLFLSAWLLGAQPQVMRCLCLLKKSAFCVCM